MIIWAGSGRNMVTVLLLVFLAGCVSDPINPINIAPDGSYTPYIRWEIDSYEWGYRRMPVNWCRVYG